ncbi:hypothetical protein JCGZ_25650 [Jatropha curcas]|uniref:Protein FLX-like 2 n=1 Tax=Jatropha curcas TaxID=180498 RepID=A0A067JXT6_JATCU|nr:protein FLX-like 2 [Jatropha curcas]KDP24354.1 hypothetical protein JCGZ_25650 [Jatropha curcas]
MGSKGRIPPPHLRRPLPGPGIMHPEQFAPGMRPPLGPFPPFDMLPPPEIMEQKLAAQHVEMQRLATENQRLAATHGSLRQELAAAKHELQLLHAHIGAIKSEREQQMRGLTDNIAKVETELKATESVRLELQQARAEADKLVVARQELISKVHQLNQDLHRAHADVQQIPVLMSELESLRQEYQRCRVSYEYEKKVFSDHLESVQAMEKNHATMAREVEKLRLVLSNTANVDMRTVASGPYVGATGNSENEASVRPAGQNVHDDGYGVPQGQGYAAIPGNSGAGTGAGASANASTVTNAGPGAGTPTYTGAQSGSATTKSSYDAPRGPGYEPTKGGPGYDASRGPGYDVSRGAGYDAQRGHGYDSQRGPVYDMQRGPTYDAQRLPGYDVQRGPPYDVQRGPHYDASRGAGYDAQRGPHGQMAPVNTVSYGSATPTARAGSVYEAPARGGNPRR